MLTGTEPEHCNDRADAPTALWEILPLADCRIYYLMLYFIAGARFSLTPQHHAFLLGVTKAQRLMGSTLIKIRHGWLTLSL